MSGTGGLNVVISSPLLVPRSVALFSFDVLTSSQVKASSRRLLLDLLDGRPACLNRVQFVPYVGDSLTVVQPQPASQGRRLDVGTGPQDVLNPLQSLAQFLGDSGS